MRFSNEQIALACQLKDAGLAWTPGVGQYAYDREERIHPGSPFQDRVYFFLEFPCFIDYFGGLQALHDSMVWLPTFEQATQLIRDKQGDVTAACGSETLSADNELDSAYRVLLHLIG